MSGLSDVDLRDAIKSIEELISPASTGYSGRYLNPNRVEGAK